MSSYPGVSALVFMVAIVALLTTSWLVLRLGSVVIYIPSSATEKASAVMEINDTTWGSPPYTDITSKVFGVGLSETGASAMSKVLTTLGYSRVVYRDASLGTFMHHVNKTANMTGRYDDVDTVWDVPTAGYYKQLLEAYPDAKFVLTTRDSDSWYNAIEKAVYSTKWGCNVPIRLQRLHENLLYGSPLPNREGWIRAYEQHNEDVKSFFAQHAPSQLLIVDHSEIENGDVQDASDEWNWSFFDRTTIWMKICPFLGIEDGPCSGVGGRRSHFLFSFRSGSRSSRRGRRRQRQSRSTTNGIVEKCLAEKESKIEHTKEIAYVMMLCDPANEDQIGEFRMLLALKESIRRFEGYVVDVVVMVLGSIRDDQLRVLENEGFNVKIIDSIGFDISDRPSGLDRVPAARTRCLRAKLRILEQVEYEKVIFLENDMLLKHSIKGSLAYLGNASLLAYDSSGSPLSAAQFAVAPSAQTFADVVDIMESDSFHPEDGWLEYGLFPYWKKSHGLVDWKFWGSTWDQGVMYYYFDKVLDDATILREGENDRGVFHYPGSLSPFKKDPTKAPYDDQVAEYEEKNYWFFEWYRMWNAVRDRLVKQALNDPDVDTCLTFLKSKWWWD